MISLPFTYKGNEYQALVNEGYPDDGKEFRITIMDGELEQMFFPSRIIKEVDCTSNRPLNKEDFVSPCLSLRLAIIKAIQKNLLSTNHIANFKSTRNGNFKNTNQKT